MNVDIIIPIYNQAKYLSAAIGSAMAQGVKSSNILVIDDGSTDNPKAIAEYFGTTFLVNELSRGPAGARNTGIIKSNSDFISFLDADDIMLPGKISKSIECLSNSQSKMVCGNYQFWINRSRVTAPFYKTPIKIDYSSLIKNNYVASGSVTLRRDALEDVGLFDENFLLAEDYDLWLRISESYQIDYLHEPLYLYSRNTIEKTSLTSRPENLPILIDNVNKIKNNSKKRMQHQER